MSQPLTPALEAVVDIHANLSAEDLELFRLASDLIAKRYRRGWHHIGCAMRTKSGRVYTSINVDAYVSSLAVCAEAIAIGMAAAEGDADIDTIIAVRQPSPLESSKDIYVVSPCGQCREMIMDYGRDAHVIMMRDGELQKRSISELLPDKYVRQS